MSALSAILDMYCTLNIFSIVFSPNGYETVFPLSSAKAIYLWQTSYIVSGTAPSRASPIRDKIGNKSGHEVEVMDMSLTCFSRATLLSEFSERSLV